MITRREALKQVAAVTVATSVGFTRLQAQGGPPAPAAPAPGPFKLDPLPYAVDALEPFIDAQTMGIHHDRHHAAYVANLNKAVAPLPEWSSKSADELVRRLAALPESIRTAVRNNGGGHVNHAFFWQLLKKNEGGKPTAELARAIDQAFGSFSAFQQEFAKAALGVFGSGWAWLTLDGKALKIEGTPNQDSPLTAGRTPLLGLDVWEHAYYLKYQNKRADYVQAFWNVVNWEFVAATHRKASA